MTVLITGATSGIGEACARRFASRGDNLVLVARREEALHRLAAELSTAHGILVTTVPADLSVRSDAESVWERAGRPDVDVLVNNAGLAKGFGPVVDDLADDWDAMIDTNVKAVLWVTKPVVKRMIARGLPGHVVNMGSLAGLAAYPNAAVYCATKAAVKAITDGLRQDVDQYPIRVTLIQPGMVETNFSMVRFRGDAARAKSVYQGIEPLTAADVADVVLYAVQAPAHVQVAEVTLTATHQSNSFRVHRRP